MGVSRLGPLTRRLIRVSTDWSTNHMGRDPPQPLLPVTRMGSRRVSTKLGEFRRYQLSGQLVTSSGCLPGNQACALGHPWVRGSVRCLRTTSIRLSSDSRDGRDSYSDGGCETSTDIDDEDDVVSGDLLAMTNAAAKNGQDGRRRTKQTGKGSGKGSLRKIIDRKSLEGKDILYGIAPCLVALEGDRRTISRVFVTPNFKASARPEVVRIRERIEARCLGGLVEEVSHGDLDRVTRGRPHQGVGLLTSRLYFEPLPDQSIDEGESLQEPSVYICFEQIQDPMNLGAILRSAYYLGADRVLASQRNCCSLTPMVSKASSGVMEVMPVYATSNMPSFLQMQREKGWAIVGATSASSSRESLPISAVADFKVCQPTALVVGSEGSGLSEAILAECSHLVTIPAGRQLLSGIDSLNVSVAVGILLQSILQQRSLRK